MRFFAEICVRAAMLPELGYRSALLEAPRAQAAVLEALLLDLPTLAPALRERGQSSRPQLVGSGIGHDGAMQALTLLGSEVLRPALQAKLSAAGAAGLQAACALLCGAAELACSVASQLPSTGSVDRAQLVALLHSTRFLGTACLLFEVTKSEQRLGLQEKRRLAAAVLPALPCFLALMRAQMRQATDVQPTSSGLSQEEAVRTCAVTCEHFKFSLSLLNHMSMPAGSNGNTVPHPITASLADVAAWAAAASTALQAVPLAADLLPLMAASTVHRIRVELAHHPPLLAKAIDALTYNVTTLVSGFVFNLRIADLDSVPAAAELAATLPSLWQLHSTACRRLHWFAANPAAAAAVKLPIEPKAVTLLGPLRHSFVAAHAAWAALCRRLESEEGGSARRADKHDRWVPPACQLGRRHQWTSSLP